MKGSNKYVWLEFGKTMLSTLAWSTGGVLTIFSCIWVFEHAASLAGYRHAWLPATAGLLAAAVIVFGIGICLVHWTSVRYRKKKGRRTRSKKARREQLRARRASPSPVP